MYSGAINPIMKFRHLRVAVADMLSASRLRIPHDSTKAQRRAGRSLARSQGRRRTQLCTRTPFAAQTMTDTSPPFLPPTQSTIGFAFNLPDDLIRVIIRQLEDREDHAASFETLAACSAVSRQWRGATMSPLFTHIHPRYESSPRFAEVFTGFLAERPLMTSWVKFLTLSSCAD